MRLNLHDIFHEAAGEPRLDGRPPIDDAVRGRLVRVMHERLRHVTTNDGSFSAALPTSAGELWMRVTRHGTAAVTTWSDGRDGRTVAAGALLAGSDSADDTLALRALQELSPRLPFNDADYAGVAAAQRPCLATMYLDAAWFNNACVELTFTSLALAALVGPDGRLRVRDGPRAMPVAPAPAEPEVAFDFTRDRLRVVAEMAMKKAAAAMSRQPAPHFRVYPPEEVVYDPALLQGRALFARLKDTVWCVEWFDGRLDHLSFGEFLGFLDQIAQLEEALTGVHHNGRPDSRRKLNTSTWGPSRSTPRTERQPIYVKPVIDTRSLVEDANIGRLLDAVTLEPSAAAEA